MRLEDLQPRCTVRGVHPDEPVEVVNVRWHGSEAIELTYKKLDGDVAAELLYREDEPRLELVEEGRAWSFDGDGALFRLVSEAQRIRLAHLFDRVLAVHTSVVDPLPHQITAVYESMLPRQPLRFLLADDPGAGKTIMAGLLIKELIARGDLERCLVVCPGGLAEQWQDELYSRFHLPFEILTNDKLEAARTRNWFLEANLVIARLDKLSRDEDVQQKLKVPEAEWDLVVCDEAHKFSATYFSNEIKYTKRYRLGQLLSGLTRHFLLMTATPHNGKETDFQLFMALLDGDRFEGRFRDGVHTTDVSDLMRRMVKERLLKFDGKPLFPERIAYTVPFRLSDEEARLYAAVTAYVREEFNRAEALANAKRAGTVGFALTILQRRLASSPEAIYRSLRRRRERLQSRLRELEVLQRGGQHSLVMRFLAPELDEDDLEDLADAPEEEAEDAEAQILDQATAAQSIAELKAEIETLKELEALALKVRRAGQDTKWRELAALLAAIFTPSGRADQIGERTTPRGSGPVPPPLSSPGQKLVLFTEHRDTLSYLYERISTLLGREGSVVVIHGGVGREKRLEVQAAFQYDPEVQVLLATDAAGEGINLQRAHLMVNYDLPWNPNRLEQRFGRIHRIGQTEVCHLWNLVAQDTREGDVYRRLLEKLDQAREALGGQVFDVLGKLEFEGRPLRDLLLRAIRYGEQPEVRARLDTAVDHALDHDALQELLEERQLAHDAMDASRVQRVREDMERAEARRLQPHYIRSFFQEAFKRLGGKLWQREPGRFEVTNVPASVRHRDRMIGIGAPVLPRYERIVFEKPLVAPPDQPLANFVCPGHPLLDSVIDLTLERHRDLLRRGAVLVDERDDGTEPRVLFSIEHSLQDGNTTRSGDRQVISKRVLYVELNAGGVARHLHYAPYLDYRPLDDGEPTVDELLDRPECQWIDRDLEQKAQAYAVANVVPEHLKEIRDARLELIAKTEAAVKERLTKEINHWDHRAAQLKQAEEAGKTGARLNSGEARRRADMLQGRLQKRFQELNRDRQISPRPPLVLGGLLVVPRGLIEAMSEGPSPTVERRDTQKAAAEARRLVMETERGLGFKPVDREVEKLGYDIESRDPATGRLRFIEVKGRESDASTVTVTKNEILYSLNKPDDFILAIVLFDGRDRPPVRYVRQPFQREPDFGAASVNYTLRDLLAKAEDPR
ncbi:MAG: helicase-related protein [Acidobacteriota bacterium]|nr:helicase-related protein [Acidobacteriota bacterium]